MYLLPPLTSLTCLGQVKGSGRLELDRHCPLLTAALTNVFCHGVCFCRYDFIEIRDGNSDSADLLGKHCSNIAPAAIISSGPVLLIRFVSDYAHQGAGFSLRYEIYKTGMSTWRPIKLVVIHQNSSHQGHVWLHLF